MSEILTPAITEPAPTEQPPDPPRQPAYRYFVVFSFTTREGQHGFGNCEVTRSIPLTSFHGPEGLVSLQQQLCLSGGWAGCCVLNWPVLLPEDKPAILVANRMPNRMPVLPQGTA